MESSSQGYSQPVRTPSSMSLGAGETIIWSGKRCFESLIGKVILGIVLIIMWLIFGAFLGFFGILFFFLIFGLAGILSIIGAILAHIGSEYVITNNRIYMRYGVIRRRVSEAKFEKITDTLFIQKIWGRLLNYGNVGVNTPGTAWHEIVYTGVKDPENVLNILRSHMKIKEKQDKKQQRIDRLKDKYYTGEITKAQFQEAKKKVLSETTSEG
jgi:uncharacterized membrane protein YdbT with pleckstrin-like domain